MNTADKNFIENVLRHVSDGIAVLSNEGDVVYINAGMQELFGYSPGEYPTFSQWTELVFPDERYRAMVREFWHNDILEPDPPVRVFRCTCKGGKERWCRFKVARMTDKYLVVSGQDVTELHDTRKFLLQHQKEWHSIFHAIAHPTVILSPDHTIEAANRTVVEITGNSERDLIGRKCYEIFHGQGCPPEGCPMQTMPRAMGANETAEMEMEAFDGRYLISCTPVFNDQGKLEKIIHIATDISQIKAAEDTARKSEQQLAAIYDTVRDGIVTADVNSKQFLTVNAAICRMLGYSREELLALRVFDIHPEEELPYVLEQFERQARKEFEVAADIPVRRKDGGIFYADINSGTLKMDENECLIGVFRDVTRRLETEKALKDSEKRFRTIFEEGPVCIALLGSDLRFIKANRRYCRMLGYTEKELLDLGLEDITHPEDLDRDLEHAGRLLNHKEGIYKTEKRYIRRDGGVIWGSLTVSIICDDHRQPLYFLSIVEDITERKETEAWLKKSRELLASVFDAVPDLLLVIDRNYRIIYSNYKGHDGIDPAGTEVDGTCYGRFKQLDDPCEDCSALPVFETGRPVEREMTNPADGRVREVRAFPIKDDSGEVSLVVEYVRDITDRKQAEENRLKLEQQIQQNLKLESLGILAGGIAHDFNNMLTSIMGNASLALWDMEPAHPAVRKIRDIVKASEKTRDLTRQLLTFSKGGLPIRHAASVADLIRDTACFMLSGSTIGCNFEQDENLWNVSIDTGQISQVIQNLVINAAQAMPDGGELSIRAENLTLSETDTIPLPAGSYVKISVNDKGPGIPEEELSRIFDPYYSTKQDGSGLGLAIVHSIIRNHEGHITVDSTVGSGTTFTIYLPATGEDIAAHQTIEAARVTGTGRLLIMDDDVGVRKTVATMLERLGFEASLTGDGAEAVALYRREMEAHRPFTAVILDLTVPGGMGGLETIRRLLEMDPDVTAFVSSGYADGPVMADFRRHGFAGVLPKPYTIQDLQGILATLSYCRN